MTGSLTGAVASIKVTEACNSMWGFAAFPFLGLKAYSSLITKHTCFVGADVVPPVIMTRQSVVGRLVSSDKRYAGDNRLIAAESSY
jgi:hypothetical protein